MKKSELKKKRTLDTDTMALNRLSWPVSPTNMSDENELVANAPFNKSYEPEERNSTSPAPANQAFLMQSRIDVNQRKQEGDRRNMQGIDKSLEKIGELAGFIGAALVDFESGMTLGSAGGTSSFNIEMAAAANTEVVRAKMKVMKSLGIQGGIEDILITLQDQYHLIRPLKKARSLFLYVAFDRKHSNLGLARHKLAEIESDMEV